MYFSIILVLLTHMSYLSAVELPVVDGCCTCYKASSRASSAKELQNHWDRLKKDISINIPLRMTEPEDLHSTLIGNMKPITDEKTIRQVHVLLSVQKALLGAISSQLRAVTVSWDMHRIDMYFIYDGELSEDDRESAECAATEVLANFPDDHVEAHYVRCDVPDRTPALGMHVVFRRKE